jgi:hypothetical protein
MNVNPVVNCTLIIRSQVEYSATTQTAVLRCVLEKSATGQRRGFTEVDALLTALRAELMELQAEIIPSDQQKLKNPAENGSAPAASESVPLPKAARCTGSSTPYEAKDRIQGNP